MRNEKRLKRRKTIKLKNILIALVLIIAIVIILVDKKNKSSGDNLIGNWTVDGTTYYEFNNNGKGKLRVPTGEYTFTYTTKDNIIHLDFESDKATDSDYEYSFKRKKLHLKGVNNYLGEYELTRQK